ncbi:MAG: hypothetical protein QOI20_1735 [Acidimicrobiaceae bacterium]|jgi:predicted ATP-grasp superfamily ATP-dependent carboligase|nr:hypothetical protein [Acidimicrobiaceae bacterium]
MRVLVLAEGENRGALAAVRALAASGHDVHVGGPGDEAMVSRSRHVAGRHRIPWPGQDPAAFTDAVEAVDADVVLPASDATLLGLARRPPRRTRLAFPGDAVERLLDKRTVSEAAAAVGLPVPRTLPDDWAGPAVVKARSHGLSGRSEAVVTDDPQRVVAALRGAGAEPLVQEVLGGDLTAIIVVAAPDGSLLGHVQQRAVRVWPQPAGVSSRAETESADPAQVELVRRLLTHLGWWGVAQAQFLEGRLIDLNGRLFGSLALSIGAGLPVTDLLVSLAAGDRPSAVGQARPGVRYTWLEGDVRRALAERRGGLLADLRETLREGRRSVPVVWDGRDALPGVLSVLALARRAGRKALG